MTIWLAEIPPCNRPSITAATTAGRVPMSVPEWELTLMPMTSFGVNIERQAAAGVFSPVTRWTPVCTMAVTRPGSGLKKRVAMGSRTFTTCDFLESCAHNPKVHSSRPAVNNPRLSRE